MRTGGLTPEWAEQLQQARICLTRIPVAERFWAKVEKTDGCWSWKAKCNHLGYGRFDAGRETYAHRVSWELTHGPIPEGLRVLHRCDNPPCVNPEHLFLGTQTDNMQDRKAKGRDPNTRKTHCKHGHEFTPENTRRKARTGERACRTCQRARSLAGYYAAKAAL